jgi:hypothetical protein
MRAIKINTEEQTVTEIDLPEQGEGIDISELAKEIGCTYFECVRVGDDDIYIDEIGRYRTGEQGAFSITGYPETIIGNAIILSHDFNGESREPHATVDQIRGNVKFRKLSISE